MNKKFIAKDCLPFDSFDDKGRKIPIEAKDIDKVMRRLCDYWYTSNGLDDDNFVAQQCYLTNGFEIMDLKKYLSDNGESVRM